jgi:hypothetical protein
MPGTRLPRLWLISMRGGSVVLSPGASPPGVTGVRGGREALSHLVEGLDEGSGVVAVWAGCPLSSERKAGSEIGVRCAAVGSSEELCLPGGACTDVS